MLARRRQVVAGLVLIAFAGGCARDDAADGTDAATGTEAKATTTTGQPGVTVAPTTPPPATAIPATTLEVVTTQIVGSAVGGNSGGVGSDQTNTFSETVRNADGTCSGHAGPGGGPWTQGLESGAPVVFLARASGAQIGAGELGVSAWEDVDPGADEQWNCSFPFTGTIEGTPESFEIKVADLEPWALSADPTQPGHWIASVNTVATIEPFTSCTSPDTSATQVFEWDAVGRYWSEGIPSLCGNGLVVVAIERACRPPGFASDHIVAVTRADDPSVVLDDAGGVRVDPAALEPLTEVIVHVATGRPCG